MVFLKKIIFSEQQIRAEYLSSIFMNTLPWCIFVGKSAYKIKSAGLKPTSSVTPRRSFFAIFISILFILNGLMGVTQPSVLSGTVTDAQTGNAIIGARVSVGSQQTWSVAGGSFSLTVSPGTAQASAVKSGYLQTVSPAITFPPGGSAVWNFSLPHFPSAVSSVSVSLDTTLSPFVVPVTWPLPSGDCEVLYDDGIQDGFTIWAQQGNMNAVRFTPPGYPAKIKGGKIHTGKASDYPSGSYPFVPFQVVVMASDGPGSLPGTVLAGPVDVSFSSLGWVEFAIPQEPEIFSGDFYLVMIQGGNAPNAAGLAVDNTGSNYRSYSRFVGGANQWIPASGNFMIRATVISPGGPLSGTGGGSTVSGYAVSRLRQGEELNPLSWIPVATTGDTTVQDPSWNVLPCGPYRWGVKALYPAGSSSAVTFSNILGKCWTALVGITAQPGCTATPPEGSRVSLKNLVYPDSVYAGLTDSAGVVHFSGVWKGTYELKTERFGYLTALQTVGIGSDTAIVQELSQEKIPPSGLQVNESSLLTVWNKPRLVRVLFSEDWSSGSFLSSGWTLQGGTNWQIDPQHGTPKPTAMFASSPQVSNYQQMLVTPVLHGQGSPALKLSYDLMLDNFGTTTLNQMAVELWDGSVWVTLHAYDNAQGSIPWFTGEADLTGWSGQSFRLRFRASGGDSYDINSWKIDNVRVIAFDDTPAADSCILGYNVMVDNIACGFVTDTTFTLPPALAPYGTVHTACVSSIWSGGASVPVCATFTSHYLVPPGNLQGFPVGDKPYLIWSKPQAMLKPGFPLFPPPGLNGYIIYRDGVAVDSVNSPDSLYYLGDPLFPGTYQFGVAARYDLSSYGYPGQTGRSAPAGPVNIGILYGLSLPLFEDWTTFSFQSNQWQLEPADGNWTIHSSAGNPLPCAMFSPPSPVSHYASSLVSQVLLGQNITCSTLWLDADFRLTDVNADSSEHLAVEIYYNNAWHLLQDLSNTGSTGWIQQHYDITPARGGYFQFRFRAYGDNSAAIQSWEVDNIHCYAVCNPPEALTGDPQGYDVVLNWLPPHCTIGHSLDEGFENEPFPPAGWSRIQTNAQISWFHSPASTPMGVHAGSWAAGLSWDYSHQDEWLIADEVMIDGNLTFWSYCYQGSVHQDHYYVKISIDNGQSWTILLDLSDLPPYGSTGYNEWNEPYTIDLSFFYGQVARIAWQAKDGNGLGLWYPWGIDDCRIGSKKLYFSPAFPEIPPAYDIFRLGPGTIEFVKINELPLTDSTYTDAGLQPGLYSYYVASNSPECSNSVTSDTIEVDVITGTTGSIDETLRIFPNPADDYIIIRSYEPIRSFKLFDLPGRILLESSGINQNEISLNVSAIPPGVYFLSVSDHARYYTRKIIISRP